MPTEKTKKTSRISEDLENGRLYDSSPLCCCEYYNVKGDRTHLAALLCDCQELDDSVERCLRGNKINGNQVDAIGNSCTDRIRLPWYGGAKKIQLDVILPIVILPPSLHLATLSQLSTILVFIYLPYCLIISYTLFLRKKNRTGFFHYWGLTSVLWAYVVYIYYVAKFTSTYKNLLIASTTIVMFYFYAKVRFNPMDKCAQYEVSESERNSVSECKYCGKIQVMRMQHCRVCNTCVPRRDHHCVWIDNCIGAHNHREFIMSVVMFLVNSLLIFSTTFPNICYFDGSFPTCQEAYSTTRSSYLYVLICYAAFSSIGMTTVLTYQSVLISCNTTGSEIRSLPRGINFFQGLNLNPYNQGFFTNWKHFILMDSKSDILDKHAVFET